MPLPSSSKLGKRQKIHCMCVGRCMLDAAWDLHCIELGISQHVEALPTSGSQVQGTSEPLRLRLFSTLPLSGSSWKFAIGQPSAARRRPGWLGEQTVSHEPYTCMYVYFVDCSNFHSHSVPFKG